MTDTYQAADLGIASRRNRSQGRTSRDQMANARVTKAEQRELADAAKREGKALSEWAREVLLRESRLGRTDSAVFTEIVALRMLLNTVLRSVALGERMTPEAYAQVLAEVRTEKHGAAKDMLSQYQNGDR